MSNEPTKSNVMEVGDWSVINKETMDKAIASGLRTVIGKTPDPATIEQLPNGNFRFKIAQAPRKPRADKGTRRATTTTTSNKGAV